MDCCLVLVYNLCIFGAWVSDAKRFIQKKPGSNFYIHIYQQNVRLGNVREKMVLCDTVYFAIIKIYSC